MTPESEINVPEGKELTSRWNALSRPVQGELWRKIRKGESSDDEHEALMIAAMAKHRLHDWTMRPLVVLPAFVGVFLVLSLVIEDFSFQSSLPAPLVYAAYMLWMRGTYQRAYRRSIEVLQAQAVSDG